MPVILNLQGIETTLVVRMIDFSSGLTYALDGGMQRIADKVFHAHATQRASSQPRSARG